ncbi:hypothetical protein SAMN02746093_02843 [Legionella quinlivanii DSM 21216]|uniref:hypothetical protein n=1 Tax=Legionella quinlivanii TaxID=45073 RepID=UPI00089EAE60|nr:hypothetical protein [Legionella quinlivanii]SEG40919.1 hypothetical protein SAMN02746093_02843 [Legionella quinlivanii DSM 21216]
MFSSKPKNSTIPSLRTMALHLSCKIIPDKPAYLGSDLCDRFDSNSHIKELNSEYALCTSIELLEIIYDALISDANRVKNQAYSLEIRVIGTLGDKSINQSFSTVDDFNTFMNENQLLPNKISQSSANTACGFFTRMIQSLRPSVSTTTNPGIKP